MKIDVVSQLPELAKDAKEASGVTKNAAIRLTKSVSFAVEKRIKIEMPVDKGRARASWGHWSPSDLKGLDRDDPAGADDSVWSVDDGGLTITQGSNVVYIGMLNAGHSRQAPAGFIDRAYMFGQLILEEKAGLIDPLSPAYTNRLFLATFG